MPPLRTRPLLLVLLSIGLLYYSSGKFPLSSYLRGFETATDTHSYHEDAVPIHAEITTHTDEILLVSAFFPLNYSRHSEQEYERSMGNLLGSIKTPVYFFTPPEIASLIRRKRGPLPITINSSYTDPFDVPPVQGLFDHYDKMRRWQNKDRKTEGPGLYALRTAKPWFLAEAVENYKRELPPGSKAIEYAFWVDIGSFNDGLLFHDWPNVERVREVFKEGAEAVGGSVDDLIFFPMNDVPNLTMQWWKEDMGPFSKDFAQSMLSNSHAWLKLG